MLTGNGRATQTVARRTHAWIAWARCQVSRAGGPMEGGRSCRARRSRRDVRLITGRTAVTSLVKLSAATTTIGGTVATVDAQHAPAQVQQEWPCSRCAGDLVRAA